MEENQTPAAGEIATPAAPGMPTATVAKPPTVKANKIIYHARTGALYGLWLTQFFLSILTLGIYHFWGKTKIRRFQAGGMELDGDRFEYTGTGKELFLGFLKIVPIYIAVVIVQVVLQKKGHPELVNVVLLPLILYFLPVAKYSGFRYRVNRIRWRGLRGYMAGSALSFGWLYFKGTLLSIVTLGIKNPEIDLQRWEYQVQNLRFGSAAYTFKGDPSRLKKTNITTMLLAIPTLGWSRYWYNAALQREKLRGLALGDLRFRSTATGGALLKFMLGNLFIMIFTLGFGSPLVMQRNMRLYERFIAVGGDLQAFNAEQTAQGGAGDAEGMLDFLDMDIGLVDMIGA